MARTSGLDGAIGRNGPSMRKLGAAAAFALENLERRMLLCTLDHPADAPHLLLAEVGEVEPNDTAATATPLVSNSDTLIGSLSNAADVDYFSVNLAQGQLITINVGTDPGQRHYKPLVQLRDPNDNVLHFSGDGHRIEAVAATAGTHFIRVSSQSRYGTITGNYGTSGGSNLISVSVGSVLGVSETEPNDTPAQANSVSATTTLRGTIGSAADVDTFAFSTGAGAGILLKSAQAGVRSPGMRILNATNAVVAENLDGTGLAYMTTAAGTHRVQLVGTKTGGATYTGGYAVSLQTISLPAANAVVEPPADVSPFAAAPALPVGTSATRAVGALDFTGDMDLFSVNLVAGRTYSFTIDTASSTTGMRSGRQLVLFNELGQFMETSYTGALATGAATGFGFRIERTGRHFVGIQAIDDAGLGGYTLTAQQTATFPQRRDVPLVFHDYTGQRTHLGYGPAEPLTTPATIPHLIGVYESRYDIYDIDITTTLPTGTFLTFGMGEFGSIGAYGYGGSFSHNAGSTTVGQRRVSGQSLVDDPGSGFTSISGIRGAASVMNQEIGHASGTYAHARQPLAAMAYDSQSSLIAIGQYTPFPWTDSRVPDVEFRNERDYYDLVLQSGRIAEEVEPNHLTPQNLTPFLNEMTADALPRNDRVTLLGRIDSFTDVDLYNLTVAAGATFAIDIDSAEFQNPLDAVLQVLDSNGSVIAESDDALDRETGIDGVDPYLVHTFNQAGTYTLRITGKHQTFGNYRLRITSAAAFETDGPRVIGSLPNGGVNIDSTRQLTFFFNDQLDPATLRSDTIIVAGNSTGVRSGTWRFDPTDTTLVWFADAPLPVDSYTVTLVSGPNGITDLRGNPLDGETGGVLIFPAVSGDGTPGGNFVTGFSIFGPDTTAAIVSSSSQRRHPYNRAMFTLNMSDELSIRHVYDSAWTLRSPGPDGMFNTADDRLQPLDPHYDKIRGQTGNRIFELYTRGHIEFGVYRVEGTTLDAAGNNVVISRSFNYASSVSNGNLVNGPSVAELNFRPGEARVPPPAQLNVAFSLPLNLATLNADTFRLRYSSDAVFFNADDALIDGSIQWSPATLTASFVPSSPLEPGYYLLELSDAITGTNGLALDGEFLDAGLLGNTTAFSHWNFVPSGDGFAGGDFRVSFVVADVDPPGVVDGVFAFETAPQSLAVAFTENVGPSLSMADVELLNLTTALPISGATLSLVYDAGTNTMRLTFPGQPGQILPDGNYRLTLLSTGITDRVGFALDGNGNGQPGGDYVLDFFFLNADANRDRSVDIGDFAVVASNFNAAGTFSQGDFDYDGQVGIADFAILASKFNTQLPAARAGAFHTAGASADSGDRARVARPSPRAGATPFGDRKLSESLAGDVLI